MYPNKFFFTTLFLMREIYNTGFLNSSLMSKTHVKYIPSVHLYTVITMLPINCCNKKDLDYNEGRWGLKFNYYICKIYIMEVLIISLY